MSSRWIWLAVVSTSFVLDCAQATVVRSTSVSNSSARDEHTEGEENVEVDEPELITSSTPEREPPIVLWCSDDKGPACLRAAEEVGVRPTVAERIPRLMLTSIQDLRNDCNDPQIRGLASRLTETLSLEWGLWHDHTGGEIVSSEVGQLFAGAGCINCCNPDLASVKIHEVESSVGPQYFVRVWEAGVN